MLHEFRDVMSLFNPNYAETLITAALLGQDLECDEAKSQQDAQDISGFPEGRHQNSFCSPSGPAQHWPLSRVWMRWAANLKPESRLRRTCFKFKSVPAFQWYPRAPILLHEMHCFRLLLSLNHCNVSKKALVQTASRYVYV